jgi:hypothetical protein
VLTCDEVKSTVSQVRLTNDVWFSGTPTKREGRERTIVPRMVCGRVKFLKAS